MSAPGEARRRHRTPRLFSPPCHLGLWVEPQRTMNDRPVAPTKRTQSPDKISFLVDNHNGKVERKGCFWAPGFAWRPETPFSLASPIDVLTDVDLSVNQARDFGQAAVSKEEKEEKRRGVLTPCASFRLAHGQGLKRGKPANHWLKWGDRQRGHAPGGYVSGGMDSHVSRADSTKEISSGVFPASYK